MSTICIVDENKSECASMADMLGPLDIQIYKFYNGEDFLSQAKAINPDCLISEAELPDMTGLDLIEKLDNQAIRMPIVIVSHTQNIRLAVDIIKAGAVDFIHKSRYKIYLPVRIKHILMDMES